MVLVSSIFSFYIFFLQIILFTYFLLFLFILLYHFHDNLLLCLISFLCFFDNKFFYPILSLIKKFIMIYFFHLKVRSFHYVYCIIFSYVPKMNSIITSCNRNNSDFVKIQSFCIKPSKPLQAYGSHLQPISLKYQ